MLMALFLVACAANLNDAINQQNLQQVKSAVKKNPASLNSKLIRGVTPLHLAVQAGNLDIIQYLVSNGADVNAFNFEGDTPLHNAASNSSSKTVEYLISQGADVTRINKMGDTPLHMAAYTLSLKTIQLLIEHGADVNATNKQIETPFSIAVHKGNEDIITYLIKHGADVTIQDNRGMTPLHYATYENNPNLILLLLDNNADISATNIAGKTPLDIAEQNDLKKAAEVLKAEETNQIGDSKIGMLLSNQQQKKVGSIESYAESRAQSQGEPTPAFPFLESFHALVIGNNDYVRLPRLITAVTDSRQVASVLREEYGFHVQLIENGTRREIVIALDEMRSRIKEDDNLLIYYAGHGYYDEQADRGYWLPVEAERHTTANWISNADITDKLKAIKARHIMVVVDSCYSGALTRGINIRIREPGYFERIARKRSRTVMTSGGNEPVYDGGGDGHSIFARAFIIALKENPGIIDGTSLFIKIRRPVMVNAPQTPQYSDLRFAGHDGGDFIFIRQK